MEIWELMNPRLGENRNLFPDNFFAGVDSNTPGQELEDEEEQPAGVDEVCRDCNTTEVVSLECAVHNLCVTSMRENQKKLYKEALTRAIREKDIRFKRCSCQCRKWSWWWRSDYFHKNPRYTRYNTKVYVRNQLTQRMKAWGYHIV